MTLAAWGGGKGEGVTQKGQQQTGDNNTADADIASGNFFQFSTKTQIKNVALLETRVKIGIPLTSLIHWFFCQM